MNIVTLKKSAIAALTIAVVATGSLSATSSPAAAGGKHFGAGIVGGIALGLIAGGGRHGYRDDRYYGGRRHYSRQRCWHEREWRTNRWGERYSKRVRVCN